MSKHVQEIVNQLKMAKSINCYKIKHNESRKLILIKSQNYFFNNDSDIVLELSDNRMITFQDLEFADIETLNDGTKAIVLGSYEFQLQD
jgi:hypothetical protein